MTNEAGLDYTSQYARREAACGATALHGQLVGRVKGAGENAVIGSSDGLAPAEVTEMMRETGCDAVMIARAVENHGTFSHSCLLTLLIHIPTTSV
jgi:tRNA-dihydrouridine synthase